MTWVGLLLHLVWLGHLRACTTCICANCIALCGLGCHTHVWTALLSYASILVIFAVLALVCAWFCVHDLEHRGRSCAYKLGCGLSACLPQIVRACVIVCLLVLIMSCLG